MFQLLPLMGGKIKQDFVVCQGFFSKFPMSTPSPHLGIPHMGFPVQDIFLSSLALKICGNQKTISFPPYLITNCAYSVIVANAMPYSIGHAYTAFL